MAKKPKTLDVPLDQLTTSPLNPRKTFSDRELADLAASIEADGILQTLLVRPVTVEGRETGGYEILCGARRFRAASLIGHPKLPVRVRFDLDDDADALEAMITENSQRADVPPLEEADAYQSLLERGEDDPVELECGECDHAFEVREVVSRSWELVPASKDALTRLTGPGIPVDVVDYDCTAIPSVRVEGDRG